MYDSLMRVHVNPVLGATAVAAVTSDDCERLILALKPAKRKKALASSTKLHVVVTLQALFSYAMEKKKRPDNPASTLRNLAADPDASPDDDVIDPKDHTKYFTAEEASALLRSTMEHHREWYVFVRTGIETGMRIGELAALRYEHINWHGRYINVQANYVSGRFTTPKNRKKRTVSLSKELRKHLRLKRWRGHQASSDLVFPMPGGKPIDARHFRRRVWQQLVDSADLDYRTPHAMRHTHTSLNLQKGVAPAKVAAEAGRSLEETMRTYAHFLPGGNRDDADVIADLLGASEDKIIPFARTHVSPRRETAATKRQPTATKQRVASRK